MVLRAGSAHAVVKEPSGKLPQIQSPVVRLLEEEAPKTPSEWSTLNWSPETCNHSSGRTNPKYILQAIARIIRCQTTEALFYSINYTQAYYFEFEPSSVEYQSITV